ncbi:MAG: D-xylose transporter ATP-binding protein, partial [Bacillota bacterium]|nr:D-xylose transporter ATP-binding protein [Bacillota bacterium]
MKKEMLRINNLNMEYSTTEQLRNITLCLLAGECVGFLGLENSGKRLLEDFICGKLAVNRVSFYFDGVRRINTEDLCGSVYKIISSNYLIDDWTVAEYIFLVDESSFFGINKKRLAAKTEELFLEFGLDLNPDRKLKKLTELEKRMVDLLKAYSKQSRIVVIEDEFEGCSTMDIKKFKELLDRVSSREMAVVVNSHSDHVSRILADKFIIFKKGSIVKKCRREYFNDSSNLEELLLGRPQSLPDIPMPLKEPQGVIYSVHSMTLKQGRVFQFDFCQGEVITILSLDLKEKIQLFQLLSGRLIDKTMEIVLEQKRCDFNDIIGFVKNRIASIADMGGESELLLSMSAGNNLLIP